ncbi:uncharacterized protein LOC143026130 [Oratosquilla oratoria]|uniref:uncharacterized protein LOC143026130 n=1 Tax=Oratosquilla oratoria TaxID=337810 RepID=UPI003F759C69
MAPLRMFRPRSPMSTKWTARVDATDSSVAKTPVSRRWATWSALKTPKKCASGSLTKNTLKSQKCASSSLPQNTSNSQKCPSNSLPIRTPCTVTIGTLTCQTCDPANLTTKSALASLPRTPTVSDHTSLLDTSAPCDCTPRTSTPRDDTSAIEGIISELRYDASESAALQVEVRRRLAVTLGASDPQQKCIARMEKDLRFFLFLCRLFEEHSELLSLFDKFRELRTRDEQAESLELAEHATIVMNSIDEGIKAMENVDFFFDLLYQIGESHHKIPGFKKDYFWKIEHPFLEAVKLTLNDRYTENMDQIYRITIKFLIETVIKGYEQAEGRKLNDGSKENNDTTPTTTTTTCNNSTNGTATTANTTTSMAGCPALPSSTPASNTVNNSSSSCSTAASATKGTSNTTNTTTSSTTTKTSSGMDCGKTS